MQKTVLITGCSEGGFGAAIAKEFHSRGYYVFATLRNTSKAGALAQLPNVQVLELDVTNLDHIKRAAQDVAKHTGGILDVLVNNAGADCVMPMLDIKLEKARQIFELNFWSVFNMTEAFAPLLIKARGAICNICTTAAAIPLAWSSMYSTSKAAERQLSDVMRVELGTLGVRVTTGMIGAMHTQVHINSGELQLPENSYYQCIKDGLASQNRGEQKPGSQAPELTAKRLVNDIVSGKVGETWRGGLSSVVRYCAAFLPQTIFEHLINGDKGLEIVRKAYIYKSQ
ncbi:putative short-chain dehydrogenase/reductase [Xylaria venustula]|nr:putative short-chain dehydrogenase/reductase [Xylaria venustula]